MKYRLLLPALAVYISLSPLRVAGQYLLQEDFTISSGQSINNAGWGVDCGSPDIAVSPAGLVYPGYVGSGIGNSALIMDNGFGNGASHSRNYGGSGTPVYVGFLIQVQTAPGGYSESGGCSNGAPTIITFGDGSGGSNNDNGLIVQDNGGVFRFGLYNGSSPNIYPSNFNYNETYFVVIRRIGCSMDLYDINPPLGGPEAGIIRSVSLSSCGGSLDRIHLSSRAEADLLIDGIRVSTNYSDIVATAPSIQASAITFSSVNTNSMNVNWAVGNGTGRLVLAKLMAPVDADPVNGTFYNANSSFGLGDQVGAGNYVVFNGASNSVGVLNLPVQTTIYYKVYEYNQVGSFYMYNTSDFAGNPASQSTLYSEPAFPSNSIAPSLVDQTSATLTWTPGAGPERIVIVGPNVSGADPVDGTLYSFNSNFTLAPDLNGNKIIYSGPASSASVTGLTAGTTYGARVFEVNPNSGSSGANYYNGMATENPTFFCTEPSGAAGGLSRTSVTTGSISLSWLSGNGAGRLILAKQGAPVDATPLDGTTNYSANSNFGSGTQVGTGNYVVYNGSGSTTTVFNLTAGTQYHFKVFEYCNTGSYYNYVIVGPVASFGTLYNEPGTQASNIIFTSVLSNGLTVNWTNGGGTHRTVVARATSAVSFTPADGVAYSANSNFSLAADQGSGNKVVYSGTGSSVAITGLAAGTSYFFRVFESNPAAASDQSNYNTNTATNNPLGTLTAEPTTQANTLTFSNVQDQSLTLNWTSGNGSNRMVIMDNAAVTFVPADATSYTANSNYSAGTDLGSGQKCVYNGTGSSVPITGLTAAFTYHFRVFEYNGSDLTANYNISTGTGNPASRTTLQAEPTTQASNLAFSAVQANSLTLSWTSGSGANRIVVMDDAAVGFTPADATDYAANSNYALGTDLGAGQKCVYNGAGSTVAITGLSPNVTYHFRVFEYNGSSLTSNYYTAAATGNPSSRITLVAEPTTQASSIVFTPAATTSLNFNWSNGNGAGRVVVARAGSAVDTDPADGSTYTANLTFGSGSAIGTGNYVVFSGTGTGPITVDGLASGATYHFRVYEYSGTTIQTNYNTATASGNPNSSTTLAAEPTVQAANILFSSVTTSSATLTWTNGNGATRLVLAKAGAAVDTNPTDANNYTPSTTFGSGTQLGTGNYAVYLNNGNSVTVTGLTAGTTYHFRVYELNGSPPATNFLVSTASGNPANVGTLFIEPTTQASVITFSSPLTNGFTVSWTNGNGSNRIVIVDDAAITFTPTDGTTVGANADYSAGSDLGGGQKCVYNGSGNSVAVTGLSVNTAYFVRVYEYNGAGAQTNYNITTGTGNPASRKTLFAEPAAHAASFTAAASSSSQNNLSFSAASSIANAAGYIILRRSDGTNPTITGVNDGVSPASLPLAAGTTLLTTITSTSATGFNDTGLPSGIQFNYALIPYGFDGANNETYNYRTNPVVPVANATTFVVEPPAQPTAMTFSLLAPTAFNVAWVPPGSAPAGYLVLRRLGSSPTGVPIDGTTYTVGNPLGDGTIVYIGATPSFSESGLTAASLYFYDVFAFNGAGGLTNYLNAGPLEGGQTTLSDPPSNQPTSLTFTSVTASSYGVSFAASAGGATGYVVVRRTGATPAGIPGNGTTYGVGDPLGDGSVVAVGAGVLFSESALSSNTTYHYAVFAYNGSGGNTHYLTTAPLVGSQLTFPQAPNALAATSPGQTSFTANWDAIAGITDFFIDVSSDDFSTFATGYQNQQVAGTSVSVTGLTAGTTYKFRLRAGNATGQSVNSNEQSILLIPATPVAVAGTLVTQSGFTANWNAVIGAANFHIDISGLSDFSTNLVDNKQLASTVTSEAITGLAAGTTYYYRVRASNASGTTTSSNTISQVTIPPTPGGLVAPEATTGNNSFLARWNAVTGADGYEIDVSVDPLFGTFVGGYQARQLVGGSLNSENVLGLLSGQLYYFRVRSYNQGGLSPNSASEAVLTKGGTSTPPSASVIDNQNSLTLVSASVSGGVGAKTITLFHRRMSELLFNEESPLPADGSRVDITVSPAWLDELGMEYYFVLEDVIRQESTTPKAFIYRTVSNAAIPDLSAGGKRENYRIFSIPVNLGINNDIEEVFASVISQFQGYNKEKWRLVRWQNGRNVDYTEGLIRIENGLGYWFNSVEPVDFDISGPIVAASQDAPFQLQLDDGWNQIGNPFTFGISWSDVLAKNPTKTGVGPLYVYNPSSIKFDQSNTLKAWGGGFVESDGATTIDIPVTVARASGRSGGTDLLPSDLSGETWFLPLKLEQGITFNDIGGIGMSPGASVGKDRLDELSLPRFVNYLELNGHHPEYKWPRFMRDVVPTANSFTWDLKVESNFEGPVITLSWDRSSFRGNEAMLILFDEDAQALVDMRLNDSYAFENKSERNIKIMFARTPKDFKPSFTGAGAPYPNPFSAEVFLPVISGTEPGAVGFTVTDMMGRRVASGSAVSLSPGLHTLRWDGKDSGGSNLPDGMYVYRVTSGGLLLRQGRLILKKN
jgi:hypothetical protein